TDCDRVLDLVREQVAQLPLADLGGRRADGRRHRSSQAEVVPAFSNGPKSSSSKLPEPWLGAVLRQRFPQHAPGHDHSLLDLGRQDAGRLFHLDGGPPDVTGCVEVVYERNRQSRNQRERDVLPVLVLGIIDDCPSLDSWRLPRLAENQAVRGLPDRGRDVVGQPDPALAVAAGKDRERSRILLLGRELRLEVVVEVGAYGLVENLDSRKIRELEGANLAVIRE